MFKENPFTGACASSTLEVIVMLAGTLLLGLLLGFLIWGWLRQRVKIQETAIQKFRRIGNLRQKRIVNLVSRLHAMKEHIEHSETRLSLAEYKMRRLQEEVETFKAQLSGLEQVISGNEFIETPPAAAAPDAAPEIDEDGPTLEDLTRAMESGGSAGISQENQTSKASDAPVVKGVTPASIALASEIFGVQVQANDLKIISGIDQKIEEILHRAGILTWLALSQSRLPALRNIIEEAGPRYRAFDPKTWPMQARMATKGEWKKLKTYQDSLTGD